ncbi:MAG: hypothetical protein QM750_23140 [Rubrivivax sp.]
MDAKTLAREIVQAQAEHAEELRNRKLTLVEAIAGIRMNEFGALDGLRELAEAGAGTMQEVVSVLIAGGNPWHPQRRNITRQVGISREWPTLAARLRELAGA